MFEYLQAKRPRKKDRIEANAGVKASSLVRFNDACQFAEFVFAERSVEHCHSTNPTGEAYASAAVNDAADREWPAALGVLWRVQIVRVPPRF